MLCDNLCIMMYLAASQAKCQHCAKYTEILGTEDLKVVSQLMNSCLSTNKAKEGHLIILKFIGYL